MRATIEFVDRSLAFVHAGLARSEPVLVMVGARKLELLRAALASRAADVHLVDMEVVGRNPARIIPAWSRFVADNAGNGGGMRGIGEPIWAERTASELSECQLHESLINLAFAAADEFRLICPYDTAALPEDVIAEARRSHPVVSYDGRESVSHDYCGIDQVAAGFATPLAEPPAEAEELRVTLPALRVARRLVWRRAEEAGLGDRSRGLHARGERGALEQPPARRRGRNAASVARRPTASSARSATTATSPSP